MRGWCLRVGLPFGPNLDRNKSQNTSLGNLLTVFLVTYLDNFHVFDVLFFPLVLFYFAFLNVVHLLIMF